MEIGLLSQIELLFIYQPHVYKYTYMYLCVDTNLYNFILTRLLKFCGNFEANIS